MRVNSELYNPLRSGEDVNNRREVTATGLSCTESLHTEWRCSMAQFLLPVLLLILLLLLLLLNCSCTIVAAAEELDALWAKWCCYWLELVFVAAAPAAVSILVGISFHFSRHYLHHPIRIQDAMLAGILIGWHK